MLTPLAVHLHNLDAPEFQKPFMAKLDAWRCKNGHAIELVPASERFDVLVAGVPTRELIECGPHTLIIPWSGIPRSVATLCTQYPELAVHNLHHNATLVAEHAIGMLLACARRLVPADRSLRSGDWRFRFEPSDAPKIDGRRALILGAGAIGTRIARAAAGLGMSPTMLATKPRAATPKCPLPVLGLDSLDQALGCADVLFVTLPLTRATDGLIDARRLAILPHRALVINVGRGPVIDEAALYHALTSHHLAGAGLDVWYSYPQGTAARAATPPSAFPFDELDQVVLSPHRAGHGAETERLCAEALFEALVSAASGEPLGNKVDVQRGY